MIDLDVDTPEKVSKALRETADMYYQSEVELQSAWQDRNAGRIWGKLARILESAANKADAAIDKFY